MHFTNTIIGIIVIITDDDANARLIVPSRNFTMEINENLKLYQITLKAIPNKWCLNASPSDEDHKRIISLRWEGADGGGWCCGFCWEGIGRAGVVEMTACQGLRRPLVSEGTVRQVRAHGQGCPPPLSAGQAGPALTATIVLTQVTSSCCVANFEITSPQCVQRSYRCKASSVAI